MEGRLDTTTISAAIFDGRGYFALVAFNTEPNHTAVDMWFITLVKMRKAPHAMEAAEMNKMMQEAANKMGIKIHQGFMTLGRYDAVWITEAPDISGPMRMAMMGADDAESETLVATSYEEAMKWVK